MNKQRILLGVCTGVMVVILGMEGMMTSPPAISAPNKLRTGRVTERTLLKEEELSEHHNGNESGLGSASVVVNSSGVKSSCLPQEVEGKLRVDEFRIQEGAASMVVECRNCSYESASKLEFNGRMVGKYEMVGAVIGEASPSTSKGGSQVVRWEVTYSSVTKTGKYAVDLIVTWFGDQFLGQRWFLPDRNDNPQFEEKKRKCLALKLVGDCERFGVSIFSQEVTVTNSALGSSDVNPIKNKSSCRAVGGGGGRWRVTENPSKLLADPVGLNTFNKAAWEWIPSGQCNASATTVLLNKSKLLSCLKAKNVSRLALFGDSMMVEFFHMLRHFFDIRSFHSGKARKLRYMEFTVPGGAVSVRFSRSYTTAQGKSVIADEKTIFQQIMATDPHLVLGNFAVLHWQQNMMPVEKWKTFLERFSVLMKGGSGGGKGAVPYRYYLGHTLIQMGRTQGLQPARTREFSRTARNTLDKAGFIYFDPYNLSTSRRESAFDGQHWACYHEYGGVSHSLMMTFFAEMCL